MPLHEQKHAYPGVVSYNSGQGYQKPLPISSGYYAPPATPYTHNPQKLIPAQPIHQSTVETPKKKPSGIKRWFKFNK